MKDQYTASWISNRQEGNLFQSAMSGVSIYGSGIPRAPSWLSRTEDVELVWGGGVDRLEGFARRTNLTYQATRVCAASGYITYYPNAGINAMAEHPQSDTMKEYWAHAGLFPFGNNLFIFTSNWEVIYGKNTAALRYRIHKGKIKDDDAVVYFDDTKSLFNYTDGDYGPTDLEFRNTIYDIAYFGGRIYVAGDIQIASLYPAEGAEMLLHIAHSGVKGKDIAARITKKQFLPIVTTSGTNKLLCFCGSGTVYEIAPNTLELYDFNDLVSYPLVDAVDGYDFWPDAYQLVPSGTIYAAYMARTGVDEWDLFFASDDDGETWTIAASGEIGLTHKRLPSWLDDFHGRVRASGAEQWYKVTGVGVEADNDLHTTGGFVGEPFAPTPHDLWEYPFVSGINEPVLAGGNMEITYHVNTFVPEFISVLTSGVLIPEYSQNNGISWYPCTQAGGAGDSVNIPASGTFMFAWDYNTDIALASGVEVTDLEALQVRLRVRCDTYGEWPY
jgi:hypothetical protein